jgi:hypothetical protein
MVLDTTLYVMERRLEAVVLMTRMVLLMQQRKIITATVDAGGC